MANFVSKKLRDSARDEDCIWCGTNDGTTVLAHSNEGAHGKGMGLKAHDLLSLYLCRSCHENFDSMAKDEARQVFRDLLPKQLVRISSRLAAGEKVL